MNSDQHRVLTVFGGEIMYKNLMNSNQYRVLTVSRGEPNVLKIEKHCRKCDI